MPSLKVVLIALILGLLVFLIGIQPAPGSSHRQANGCCPHAGACDCPDTPYPGCLNGAHDFEPDTARAASTTSQAETDSSPDAQAERSGRPGIPDAMRRHPPFAPVSHTSPPPKTLGFTYWRPSSLIPPDKHPRTAMVDVWAPGAQRVAAQSSTGFRHPLDGWRDPCIPGLWHFQTDEPLTPGIPHLCEVTAAYCNGGCNVPDVRTIRLIRGRIVSLEYPPRVDLRLEPSPHTPAPESRELLPTPLPEFRQRPAPPEPNL